MRFLSVIVLKGYTFTKYEHNLHKNVPPFMWENINIFIEQSPHAARQVKKQTIYK